MAPMSGLLAHALERHEPNPTLTLARVSYDILGLIRLAPTEVRVRTVRPGRTIQLLEAVAAVDGRDVVRAGVAPPAPGHRRRRGRPARSHAVAGALRPVRRRGPVVGRLRPVDRGAA